MNFFACFVFFLIAFFSQTSVNAAEAYKNVARAKPEIAVRTDEGTPEYVYKDKKIECSGSAHHAMGCTRVRFYAVISGSELTPEGALKKISLQIGLKNVEIELSSELKKGSCLFDAVLKHELTHLALHRRVLNRFVPEIAKAVLITAQKQRVPLTQARFDRITAVLKEYVNRMIEEDDKQNALMDSKDAYVYQQSQCGEQDEI